MGRQAAEPILGPRSYENWKAQQAGRPSQHTAEYPIYTDAHITGHVIEGYGPYQFLNTVPGREEPGVARASIVLRYSDHLENAIPDMSRTDTSRYHGGSPPDELAALLSLALGIRAKCGSQSRIFDGSDPMGRPVAWGSQAEPVIVRSERHQLVLRSAVGSHSLANLAPLAKLPLLPAKDAIALTRAARLYQDGLWLAESEPALAWLMLVSAVEVAASGGTYLDEPQLVQLRVSLPELTRLLEESSPDLLEPTAGLLVPLLRATKKFVTFLVDYFPDPPERRPPQNFQRPWSGEGFRHDFSLIYHYRSRALHDGTPFPAPMCEAPYRDNDWHAPSEVPVSGAAATLDAAWLREDVPMLFHLFEYVVRASLRRWWQGLAQG